MLLLVITIAVLGTGGYLYYRNNAIDRLYAEATGYPPFLPGTSESQDAVKKLATYQGRRTTKILLTIATGEGTFIWPDTRVEAIRALREREDPEVAVALANLLQPHVDLSTREAVAAALRDLPCDDACILSIMHYLERVWRGELNFEDRFIDPTSEIQKMKSDLAPAGKSMTADVKKEQKELYSTLYEVLRRERKGTIMKLKQVYGIGSNGPSPFALDLLSRLGLHEACPLLLQSERAIKEELSPEFYTAPRQELQATIASLNCK